MFTLFVLICLIVFVISIYKLSKNEVDDENSKKYKILLLISSVLLVFLDPFLTIFLFIIILVVLFIRFMFSKNRKLLKGFISFFVILFVVNILVLTFTTGLSETKKDKENSSSETKKDKENVLPKDKKDIDKMSEDELDEYIFDSVDDRGGKLYKKNKDLYKYLFYKSFDKEYDSVITPNEQTIQNLKYNKDSDLTVEENVKLEMENPKLYNEYLDIKFSNDESEDDVESEDGEDKLKESINSELSTSTLKSLDYYNDSLGSNAVIVLEGEENITDKLTSQGMRDDIANAVKGVKNSNVDLDDFQIDVTYPVEDDEGNRNDDFHVIKSKWSMSIINDLSDDQLELLNTDLAKFAISYDESTALR